MKNCHFLKKVFGHLYHTAKIFLFVSQPEGELFFFIQFAEFNGVFLVYVVAKFIASRLFYRLSVPFLRSM